MVKEDWGEMVRDVCYIKEPPFVYFPDWLSDNE